VYVKSLFQLQDAPQQLQQLASITPIEHTERLAAGDVGEYDYLSDSTTNDSDEEDDEGSTPVATKVQEDFLFKYTFWKICRDIVAKAGAIVVAYPLRVSAIRFITSVYYTFLDLIEPLFQTITCLAVSEFVGREGVM
jgi:hypothetical protein